MKKFFYLPAIAIAILLFSCNKDEALTNNGNCNDDPFGSDPYGAVLNTSGCKDFSSDSETEVALNEECIKINYFSEHKILRLAHYNGGFNCCPGKISADFDFESGIIRISEKQSQSICDCKCLFDIEYELRNIEQGEYRFIVTGPLTGYEAMPALEAVIDISEGSGKFCIERDSYPWK